jgi:hypothetical protein
MTCELFGCDKRQAEKTHAWKPRGRSRSRRGCCKRDWEETASLYRKYLIRLAHLRHVVRLQRFWRERATAQQLLCHALRTPSPRQQ